MKGINGRLDTIQAAVLLAKFNKFENEIKKRNSIADYYNKNLIDECIKPKIDKKNFSVYAQYTIKIKNRNLVHEKLKKLGVPSMIYYPSSLHKQKVFQNYRLYYYFLPGQISFEYGFYFLLLK